MTHQPIQATIREDDAEITVQVLPGPLSENSRAALRLLQQHYDVTQTGMTYEFVHKRVPGIRATVTVVGRLPDRFVTFSVNGSADNATDASATTPIAFLFTFIQSFYE